MPKSVRADFNRGSPGFPVRHTRTATLNHRSAPAATLVTAAPAARADEPQRCDIVAVRTATMWHRRGSRRARYPGSAILVCSVMPAWARPNGASGLPPGLGCLSPGLPCLAGVNHAHLGSWPASRI